MSYYPDARDGADWQRISLQEDQSYPTQLASPTAHNLKGVTSPLYSGSVMSSGNYKWPPPPSVEEDISTPSTEKSSLLDEKPPMRGAQDQQPIIMEVRSSSVGGRSDSSSDTPPELPPRIQKQDFENREPESKRRQSFVRVRPQHLQTENLDTRRSRSAGPANSPTLVTRPRERSPYAFSPLSGKESPEAKYTMSPDVIKPRSPLANSPSFTSPGLNPDVQGSHVRPKSSSPAYQTSQSSFKRSSLAFENRRQEAYPDDEAVPSLPPRPGSRPTSARSEHPYPYSDASKSALDRTREEYTPPLPFRRAQYSTKMEQKSGKPVPQRSESERPPPLPTRPGPAGRQSIPIQARTAGLDLNGFQLPSSLPEMEMRPRASPRPSPITSPQQSPLNSPCSTPSGSPMLERSGFDFGGRSSYFGSIGMSNQRPASRPSSRPTTPCNDPLNLPMQLPVGAIHGMSEQKSSRPTTPVSFAFPMDDVVSDGHLRQNRFSDITDTQIKGAYGRSDAAPQINILSTSPEPRNNSRARAPHQPSPSWPLPQIAAPVATLPPRGGSLTLQVNTMQNPHVRSPSAPPTPIKSILKKSKPKLDALPNLPPCSRTQARSGYDDWSTLPGLEHFNVCPQCRKGLEGAGFEGAFEHGAAKGAIIKCDLANPWVRMAWLSLLKSGSAKTKLIKEVTFVQHDELACPGREGGSRDWHRLYDPETQGYIKGFNVCPLCAKSIELIFPNLVGTFRPSSSSAGRTRVCDLRTDSNRFVRYMGLLEQLSSAADSLGQRPDIMPFVDLADRMADISECRRDDQLLGQKWHFMPQIPEFTACEECYHDIVRPSARSGSDLARQFCRKPQHPPQATRDGPGNYAGVSCQLYSSRMREVWRIASERNDFAGLRSVALQRSRKEKELQARHKLLTGLAEDVQYNEGMKLIEEWKRWA